MKNLEESGYTNAELTLKASLYTSFLCILFGGNAVAIKITLSGIGIFTNAGIRFAFASAALLIWALMTGERISCKRDQLPKLLILSAIFILQLACFYLGLSRTSASHGTLIANLLPFIVLVLAHFFIPGDRINMKKISGIALGFSGVVFLFLDSMGESGAMKTGDIIVTVAVVFWGINAIYTKKIISDMTILNITLYPMLLSTPVFLSAGYFFDDEMVKVVNGPVLNSLAYQSFITASYGFIAWNRLLCRFGATAVHSFIFIMPVSGVFLSVMMLDEPLTANIVLSIVMIVIGTIVVNRQGPVRQSTVKAG